MFRNSKGFEVTEHPMLTRIKKTEPDLNLDMHMKEIYELQDRVRVAEMELCVAIELLEAIKYEGDTKKFAQAEYQKLEAQAVTVIMNIVRGVFGNE